MNYLTYCGNNIVSVRLPSGAEILHAPSALPGAKRRDVPAGIRRGFESPLEFPHLSELVGSRSHVLIAFDDNCQPFPQTVQPDIRRQALETVIPMLNACGVVNHNIKLVCAVALHRKMTPREMARMVGPKVFREFHPDRLVNFDAEDRANIAVLESTDEGEPVQVMRDVVECDLVIYLDSVQIPLNGGHKSVAVGLGTYEAIAAHHHPKMTAECPHVMQPDGSHMHACIERQSHVIQRHARIMVMEAAMNNATYPAHLRYLGKPDDRCNVVERLLKRATPPFMRLVPEPVRKHILRSVRSVYDPIEINTGDIDAVHERTLAAMSRQMTVPAARQHDTMVVGLPDLSPYAVGARLNPVLVVSDVLGYLFNWFYDRPLVRRCGVVIILNPCMEVFHPLYHVAYERFYREVLSETTEPFEMQERFQESFARDGRLIECYRRRYAHHGFHPFTVWYWATYALKYLSKVILVGPPDDLAARRLGVGWAPNVDHALGQARDMTGTDDVAAITVPPFFYVRTGGSPAA